MATRLVVYTETVPVVNGEATLRFPNVPTGSVWTGSILLPNNVTTSAQWEVTANGLYLGTFTGWGPYGPITLFGHETLVLTGSFIGSARAFAELLGNSQLDSPTIAPAFPV